MGADLSRRPFPPSREPVSAIADRAEPRRYRGGRAPNPCSSPVVRPIGAAHAVGRAHDPPDDASPWRIEAFASSLTAAAPNTVAGLPPRRRRVRRRGPSGSVSTAPTRSTAARCAATSPTSPPARYARAHHRPQGVARCGASSTGCADRGASPSIRRSGCRRPDGQTAACPRVLHDDEIAHPARRAARRASADDDPAVARPRRRRPRAALRQRPARRRAVRPAARGPRPRPPGRARLGQGRQAAPGAAERARGRGRSPVARRGRERLARDADARRRGVPQPAGQPAHAARRAPHRRPSGRGPDPPARPAPHLRHAPARRRCRSAGRAGAARPRRPRDDPALHPRQQGAAARACSRRRTPERDGDGRGLDDGRDGSVEPTTSIGSVGRRTRRRAPRRPRPAHRPLLAAGEVRRRPRRRRPARRTSSRPTSSATGSSGSSTPSTSSTSSRGYKFETYAIARIKGAILDELRSIDWVPRSVRAKARALEKAYAKLEGELHRTPDRRGAGRRARA